MDSRANLDSRPDVKGAVRMSEADGIAVRVMTGRTPLGRRLAMVAGVDTVVTISGKQHTEVVVEQALELGLPVLPIPECWWRFEDLLKKYRKRIAASFDPGALDRCLGEISQAIDSHPGGRCQRSCRPHSNGEGRKVSRAHSIRRRA